MWSTIAKYLLKGALWAAGHPDTVKEILEGVIKVKSQMDKKGS